jgi:DeoR/GlpR family transcriptional regulator of sugar metabolism
MRYERSTAITKRHQELLALIVEGIYSSPRLAEELGVSEQTVYRDVLFLKRQGYRIKSVRLSTNWAYRLNQRHHSQVGAS